MCRCLCEREGERYCEGVLVFTMCTRLWTIATSPTPVLYTLVNCVIVEEREIERETVYASMDDSYLANAIQYTPVSECARVSCGRRATSEQYVENESWL